jgi:hypothetical protein
MGAYHHVPKKPEVAAICINFAAKYLEPRRKFDFLVNIALGILLSIALLKMWIS